MTWAGKHGFEVESLRNQLQVFVVRSEQYDEDQIVPDVASILDDFARDNESMAAAIDVICETPVPVLLSALTVVMRRRSGADLALVDSREPWVRVSPFVVKTWIERPEIMSHTIQAFDWAIRCGETRQFDSFEWAALMSLLESAIQASNVPYLWDDILERSLGLIVGIREMKIEIGITGESELVRIETQAAQLLDTLQHRPGSPTRLVGQGKPNF